MNPAVLAVIGAGPRGVGLLERLAANAGPTTRLTVHVVDPFPPGAGRTWRHDQSPLLWMNSHAGEVTMFTDDSVRCDGPVRPGPTLAQWAGGPGRTVSDPELAGEAARLSGDDFASRRLAGAYLQWCFRRAAQALPPGVDLVVHAATALALTADAGRDEVLLSTGARIVADVVVLTQGNIDGPPAGPRPELSAFARQIGGSYQPPGFTADLDSRSRLDAVALPAGTDVVVSGLGLAFFDLLALLTIGRGGRFESIGAGRLRYRRSHAEPVLWVGSRRGLPYRPKTNPIPYGQRCPLPVFATAASLRSALAGGAHADVWATICRELGWGYYYELFHAHPDRTTMSWATFAQAYRSTQWCDPRLATLVADAVPATEDRLNLDLDRFTLRGRTFPDETALARWMRERLRADVDRATEPRHSAEGGASQALSCVADQLHIVAESPGTPLLAALGPVRSLLTVFGSGPPAIRLAQLVAASEAGVVRFLGADLTVAADERAGAFVACSGTLGPDLVRARHFIEARLPAGDVVAGDPLLGGLVSDGRGVAVGPAGHARLMVDGATYGIRTSAGAAEPGRLAMGAFASEGALGSFSRPGTDAAFFRQNDRTARRILARLAELLPERLAAGTAPA